MSGLFWTCFCVITYVYFGYPLLLALGALGRRKLVQKRSTLPTVSVVVPAHNEESRIESKLRNLLSLDYPTKIEILIGSDGSTDRTDEIVARYAEHGVQLVKSSARLGKSGIQNALVTRAFGELLVFTDADCLLTRDALLRLEENFGDPTVGLVTVPPEYTNNGENEIARNEGLYWRYENWLRQQESDRGLLASASGWLFMMRRSLWRPLDPTVGDDFVLPLQVALAGARNVVASDVRVSSELAQNQTDNMMRMKMRIVSKDFRGLLMNRAILNPLRTGAVAIGLWSHKILRWWLPYFMVLMFTSNLFLLDRAWFQATLAAQLLFYTIAGFGVLRRERGLPSPWSVPFSFCLVNVAALLGTLHCATGRTTGVWTPVRPSSK